MTKNILLTILAGISIQAFADPQALKNFTPGTYSLKSGAITECGSGEFELREGGTNVGLGQFHGFNLNNDTSSAPGDAPGDEGCVYEGKNTMDVQDAKTILTFTEVRKCKDVVKHTLTKTAELQNGKVKLEVKQTGSPTLHYSCRWTKNAAKK